MDTKSKKDSIHASEKAMPGVNSYHQLNNQTAGVINTNTSMAIADMANAHMAIPNTGFPTDMVGGTTFSGILMQS